MSNLDGEPLGLLMPDNKVERPCGSCTLCCKLVPVKTFEKPRDTWCQHCDTKRGCTIYEDRPEDCRLWSCLWAWDGDMPEALQPRRVHCLFDIMIDEVDHSGTAKPVFQLWVDTAFPDAHRRPEVRAEIERLGRRYGVPTLARIGYRGVMIFPPSVTGQPDFIEIESNMRPTDGWGGSDWQIADYEKRQGSESSDQHRLARPLSPDLAP